MPVIALNEGYQGEIRDLEENFHGQRLLYVGWEDHLMFCAPHCIPVDPQMPFEALATAVLPSIYGMHPDWASVDTESIEWFHSGQRFTPDFTRSLADNGIGHKSVIRFRTPGLTGINGSFS
ncbi:Phenol 2-monooxygenase, oxygenase component DmpO [Pararobbsia alpina]|uniref:phenol hydroxylase subunit P4 n=1 Tax=Pararobbsia alpina TaxID=621374 RepID=UPI0039A53C6E